MIGTALTPGERFLVRTALILLILVALGPLVGKAGIAQTVGLALALAVVLYPLGELLLAPMRIGLAAAIEGSAAALLLFLLGRALGARYDWGASIFLGAVAGLTELVLRRWEGSADKAAEGL